LALNISQSPPLKVTTTPLTLPGLIRGIALLPPNNQYAYVADEEGGLQVVDVSNPTAPKLAGYYSTTNQLRSSAISIFGGRAYVTDETAGLQIFDLSNPTAPALLSSTNFGGGEAIVVKGSVNGVFAYVSTSGSLCIVDVSNPLSPALRGQTSINGGSVYSIALSGNYVYAAATSGSLEIIDISNTNAPTDVGQAPSIIWPSTVGSAGGYIYATSELIGVGRSLYVFSPNGSTLTLIGQTATTTSSSSYSLLVSGTTAYVAGGSAGFQIFDISNPYSPTLSTVFTDSGVMQSYNSVAVTENSLAAYGNGFNSVFNVSNPSAPAFAYNSNVGGPSDSSVLANNGLAYVLVNTSNFIYNVSTPSAPSLVSLFANTTSPSRNMFLAGNMLYVVGGTQGNQPHFAAIDVSTPSSPVVRGTKDFTDFGSGIATSVAVSGTKALVGILTFATPVQNVVIALDISHIGSPVEQGTFTNLPSEPIDIQMSSDGSAGYVLAAGSLYVLNVSQAASPSLVTNILLNATVGTEDLKIRGNELYATTPTELYVFDVSSPMSPVLTRSYSMDGIAGISVPTDSVYQNENIYVAGSSEGIVVLQEQDDQAPDVYISNPAFGGIWPTTTSTISLGGGSDDNIGVTAITWSNNRGGSGQVSAPFDSWYVSNIPLYPGTNLLTVTAYDAAGNAGTDTLAVVYQTAKQDQTITFPAIADHTFGDAPIKLVAAASSGLQVSFSVISGSASISNNVLTLTGAGAVTVEVNQSGNDLFNAATPVDESFNVGLAGQSIDFAPLSDKIAGDAPFTLTATTSSGLPVYFNILSGPATIDANNNVTLLGGGTISIIAWQPGNSNYNAAATVQQNFNVSEIPQTITFGALSQQKVGDASFSLNATASSGLLVNFSVSGPAVLSGNIITLTGSGNVTVTASQPGNNIYAAAANVTQSFFVVPPANTLASIGLLTNGFQMNFYGSVGSNYTLQASTDLNNWTEVMNFNCTNSPMILTDPGANYLSWRFYRIEEGTLPILVKLDLNAVPFSKTNGFGMNLQAPIGFNYMIQTSTNLINWQPLTNFINPNSPFNFRDMTATNYRWRFYRAVEQ